LNSFVRTSRAVVRTQGGVGGLLIVFFYQEAGCCCAERVARFGSGAEFERGRGLVEDLGDLESAEGESTVFDVNADTTAQYM